MKSFEKLSLGVYPTPMTSSHGLGKELGIELWFKREDLCGFAFGGNKVRNAQYIFADALAERTTDVVVAGGPQSNHVRVMVAACARLGLECHLVLYGEKPKSDPSGNLLLDSILGCKTVFTGSPDRGSVDPMAMEIVKSLSAKGKRPYFIPRGGATAKGAIGWYDCWFEVENDMKEKDLIFDHIVLPTSSCGSIAGLALGSSQTKFKPQIWGVSTNRSGSEAKVISESIADKAAKLLEVPWTGMPDHVHFKDSRQGAGYAKSDPVLNSLIKRCARLEGLFLDPVFTAKAMDALEKLIERNEIPQGSKVLFIHTGGEPTIFADAFSSGLASAP